MTMSINYRTIAVFSGLAALYAGTLNCSGTFSLVGTTGGDAGSPPTTNVDSGTTAPGSRTCTLPDGSTVSIGTLVNYNPDSNCSTLGCACTAAGVTCPNLECSGDAAPGCALPNGGFAALGADVAYNPTSNCVGIGCTCTTSGIVCQSSECNEAAVVPTSCPLPDGGTVPIGDIAHYNPTSNCVGISCTCTTAGTVVCQLVECNDSGSN
jgi:hypothetical protein